MTLANNDTDFETFSFLSCYKVAGDQIDDPLVRFTVIRTRDDVSHTSLGQAVCNSMEQCGNTQTSLGEGPEITAVVTSLFKRIYSLECKNK